MGTSTSHAGVRREVVQVVTAQRCTRGALKESPARARPLCGVPCYQTAGRLRPPKAGHLLLHVQTGVVLTLHPAWGGASEAREPSQPFHISMAAREVFQSNLHCFRLNC